MGSLKLQISEEKLKPLRRLMELSNDDESRITILKCDTEIDYMYLTLGVTGKPSHCTIMISASHAEDMLNEYLRIPDADVINPNYVYFRGLSSYPLQHHLLSKIKGILLAMVNPIYQEVAIYQNTPLFA